MTTGEVVTRHLDGVSQLLVLYPYVVQGGLTVVAKTPETGLMDAHFGLILTEANICRNGYQGGGERPPQDRKDLPMQTDARCAEPAALSNARGAQNIPRAAPSYRSPVVASYDPETREVTWGAKQAEALSQTGSVAPSSLGKDTWKWLFLQPLTAGQE